MTTRKLNLRKKAVRGKRTVRKMRTVRRHRSSTAGKIMPPLDVSAPKHLKEFEKRIKKGPLTIVLVYADWCGHCHTMMPHFDAASKSPNRSIQSVKVNEKMLPAINQSINNVNKSAKPLNVEGYPSIIVVDNKGNKITDVEPVRNTSTMTKVMSNAGPLAEQAGLNESSISSNDLVHVNNSINAINTASVHRNNKSPNTVVNSVVANNVMNTKMNTGSNNSLLSKLGIETTGLSSPKNSDIGKDELKGSIVSMNTNKPILQKKKNINLEKVEAPSHINIFSAPKNTIPKITPPSNNIKQEADEITSLAAPITPPSISSDIEYESISNNLTPEQKIGGGRSEASGGSLFSALARATYTLAPAAGLIATAALVMKKGKKTSKHHKYLNKHGKSHKRRYKI